LTGTILLDKSKRFTRIMKTMEKSHNCGKVKTKIKD